MSNINQLLAQAQKLQQNVNKVQNDIKNKEVVGSSGSGAIEITLTVSGQMKSILIDKKLIDPKEKEMLEDLIIAAFNEAKIKADTIYEEAMKKATGGMHLPGLF